MSDVVYLYGFVPRTCPVPDTAVRGLDERAVELLPFAEFSAVISRLPADGYDASVIDAHLQDLQWVAERGLAHERVVAWFVDHAEIVPAPLFTLYSSAAALQGAVAGREAMLVSQLERLSGRREWDLKIAYHREQLEQHAGTVSAEVRALDQEIENAAPGRKFLLERKRNDLVKRELAAAARTVAQQLLDELTPHAESVVALAPPRTTAELPVLVAAALLLERAAETQARTLVAQRALALERIGFTVELTGPWAAYRFLDAAPAAHGG